MTPKNIEDLYRAAALQAMSDIYDIASVLPPPWRKRVLGAVSILAE